MCGIAGIINFNNEPVSEKEIKKGLNSIKHRGPDDNGFWLNNKKNVALINTRLSIQDLSKNASQPMLSEDERHILVFNGEIYNFKYLKKKYLSSVLLKSNSDTEVILNLYKKYNKNFLKLVEGMFALAIYDKKNDNLFLARDEFGVKPLYYYLSSKKMIFSSEIKSFFELNVRKEFNLRSIASYLSSEYYENRTNSYFKNILKLEPGSFMEVKNGEIKTQKYFNFYNYLKKIYIPNSYSERKDKLNSIISRCVANGMVSDVPISIASSGGLDSSILQYEVVKKNKNITLISWDFNEKEFSEKKFVNEISKITKIDPIFYQITPKKIIKHLKEIISINEEPFAGIPIISYYLTLKYINKNKVVLDGSGLDEANGGYDKYYLKEKNYNQLSQDGSLGIHNLVNKKFIAKNPNYDNNLPLINNFKMKMFNDLFFTKLPRALRFRDKISASLGLELRPVFLDKELITFLHKLDKQDHFKKNFTKFILRDTFKDKITKNIAFRNKRNVQTPQTVWFKKEMKDWLENLIKTSTLWDLDIIDLYKFKKLYNSFKNNKINNSFFIWQFINLHYFIKNNR